MTNYTPETQTLVVLLHGIGHTSWNMRHMEKAAQLQGHDTLNITYPSCRLCIRDLAKYLDDRLTEEGVWTDHYDTIHFVTHSMGGLVTQQYLDDFRSTIPLEKLGRVVMLAPPQQGSEVADFLQHLWPYKWVFGPAGQELTSIRRKECRIQPYYELGIIAGNKGWPYFVAHFLFNDLHDGRVAVDKTKKAGMKYHIVLPCTHGFISWNNTTHRQVLHFLNKGEFTS